MAIKNDREYRDIELREFELKDEDYIVEGYAALFDKPYVLWEDEDGTYYEDISSRAFENADMSDVIFLYNHEGMVYARLSNNTLELNIDDVGIKVRADLSSTQASSSFSRLRPQRASSRRASSTTRTVSPITSRRSPTVSLLRSLFFGVSKPRAATERIWLTTSSRPSSPSALQNRV